MKATERPGWLASPPTTATAASRREAATGRRRIEAKKLGPVTEQPHIVARPELRESARRMLAEARRCRRASPSRLRAVDGRGPRPEAGGRRQEEQAGKPTGRQPDEAAAAPPVHRLLASALTCTLRPAARHRLLSNLPSSIWQASPTPRQPRHPVHLGVAIPPAAAGPTHPTGSLSSEPLGLLLHRPAGQSAYQRHSSPARPSPSRCLASFLPWPASSSSLGIPAPIPPYSTRHASQLRAYALPSVPVLFSDAPAACLVDPCRRFRALHRVSDPLDLSAARSNASGRRTLAQPSSLSSMVLHSSSSPPFRARGARDPLALVIPFPATFPYVVLPLRHPLSSSLRHLVPFRPTTIPFPSPAAPSLVSAPVSSTSRLSSPSSSSPSSTPRRLFHSRS
ncbi:uncharacterized protein PSFLO_07008 [Pseudozyma flocculosa]|uniref:Uncharacterized protein n=1 Tax=Pseudozyma flocculosa TaxID=84751 RepID=A0A5C3FBL7_9BASI|nr:uncharacterized protein PSFLO_07008 [Pseudozyma flocculosa]